MLLFRSEEHIDKWCAFRELARGAIMSVDQCWQLAYAWYSDKASPDWRRRSPDESEALFQEIGLTGDFWRLRAS
jgi:hypothetical protein